MHIHEEEGSIIEVTFFHFYIHLLCNNSFCNYMSSWHFHECWIINTNKICHLFQTLFQSVLATIENGGKPVQVNASTTLGYTKEQAEAIHRLKSAKDNYERLGLTAGATRYDE